MLPQPVAQVLFPIFSRVAFFVHGLQLAWIEMAGTPICFSKESLLTSLVF